MLTWCEVKKAGKYNCECGLCGYQRHCTWNYLPIILRYQFNNVVTTPVTFGIIRDSFFDCQTNMSPQIWRTVKDFLFSLFDQGIMWQNFRIQHSERAQLLMISVCMKTHLLYRDISGNVYCSMNYLLSDKRVLLCYTSILYVLLASFTVYSNLICFVPWKICCI